MSENENCIYKFDFKLDDFQEEALFHINNGKSVVVCAPTGAGKTCIAQMAIHKALAENTRIFYTTPLKALSNQKFSDFSQKYGEDKVGLLTGDTSINRNAQIVVMTTEVFRNMLYGTNFGSVSDNLKEVRFVVLDEVHYMNDEQRGTVWEESIIYCPTNVQIIALSATVANSQQLTDWINTVHSKTELVYTDFRPVPLRYYYYDSSKPNDILPLLTPEGKLNKKIKPESKSKYFGAKGRKMPQRQVAKDVVSVLHKKNMLPAIYFTFSRKKCDEQMEKCSGLGLNTRAEQEKIKAFIEEFIADNPHLYGNKHIDLAFGKLANSFSYNKCADPVVKTFAHDPVFAQHFYIAFECNGVADGNEFFCLLAVFGADIDPHIFQTDSLFAFGIAQKMDGLFADNARHDAVGGLDLNFRRRYIEFIDTAVGTEPYIAVVRDVSYLKTDFVVVSDQHYFERSIGVEHTYGVAQNVGIDAVAEFFHIAAENCCGFFFVAGRAYGIE